jgi:hypothetical protein
MNDHMGVKIEEICERVGDDFQSPGHSTEKTLRYLRYDKQSS